MRSESLACSKRGHAPVNRQGVGRVFLTIIAKLIPRAAGGFTANPRRSGSRHSASSHRLGGNYPAGDLEHASGGFSPEALRAAREVAAAKVKATKPHSRARHWAELELRRLTLELLRAENARG